MRETRRRQLEEGQVVNYAKPASEALIAARARNAATAAEAKARRAKAAGLHPFVAKPTPRVLTP